MIRRMWFLFLMIVMMSEFIYRLSQQVVTNVFLDVLSAIGILFIIYAFYRCAYLKPGTKLLTFSLFAFVAYKILFLLVGNGNFLQSGLHPLQMIPAIWLYVLTWKMRKMNKKLQVA